MALAGKGVLIGRVAVDGMVASGALMLLFALMAEAELVDATDEDTVDEMENAVEDASVGWLDEDALVA